MPKDLKSLLQSHVYEILGELLHLENPGSLMETAGSGDRRAEVFISVRIKPDDHQPSSAAPDEPAADHLRPIDRDILEAIGAATMQSPEVAEKSGYPLTPHLRNRLSRLCRDGWLTHVRGVGYKRTTKPIPPGE